MIAMDPVAQTYAMLDADVEKETENWRPPPRRFRASESNACSREIWYRHMGYRPSPSAGKMSLYGSDGDLAHDALRMLMRKAGVKLFGLEFKDDGTIEETINIRETVEHNGEEFVIACRADGGVTIDGVDHALEIKSISGFAYSWMDKVFHGKASLDMRRRYGTGNDGIRAYIAEKYKKFLTQSHLTAWAAKLQGVYLVIKDRSSCQFGFGESNEALRYEVDMDIVNPVLDKFAMITRLCRDGTPPVREYVKSSKDCGYCNFSHHCWPEGTK